MNDKEEREVVVYDRSLSKVEERINPELLKLIMMDDLRVSINRMDKHFETEAFEGREDNRVLPVTDEIGVVDLIRHYPGKPWVTAYFINDGPSTVYVALDYPNREWQLKSSETRTIDRTHATDRIGLIFYRCDSGGASSLRVTGQF